MIRPAPGSLSVYRMMVVILAISLGPIHWLHRRADLSLFIGDCSCWGQGYASEAIALVRDWAFRELDLQKLNAGIYVGNIGSRRAFEKCGFELEGTFRQEVVSAGERLICGALACPVSIGPQFHDQFHCPGTTSSSRLPGRCFYRSVRNRWCSTSWRLQRCRRLDRLVLATSDHSPTTPWLIW